MPSTGPVTISLTKDASRRAVTARLNCLADLTLGMLPAGSLEKMLLECLSDRGTITEEEMAAYLQQHYPDCLVHEAGELFEIRFYPTLDELLGLLPATFAKAAYLVHLFDAGFADYYEKVARS